MNGPDSELPRVDHPHVPGIVVVIRRSLALVAALGLGLAETIPGRSALLDGFGLIAFASLFPMISVMAYAQISEWRTRRLRESQSEETS